MPMMIIIMMMMNDDYATNDGDDDNYEDDDHLYDEIILNIPVFYSLILQSSLRSHKAFIIVFNFFQS